MKHPRMPVLKPHQVPPLRSAETDWLCTYCRANGTIRHPRRACTSTVLEQIQAAHQAVAAHCGRRDLTIGAAAKPIEPIRGIWVNIYAREVFS